MNTENLISAAKEIDRLAQAQEKKSRKMAELASLARTVDQGSREHLKLRAELTQISATAIDFGNAIAALRAALKARPKAWPKARALEEKMT